MARLPTVVDEFALVRFDPETLDPFEVVDLATTDEQIYPCPLGDEAVPELEDFGLPPAARATRQAIFDAAIACDIGTLEELSGGQLTVPKSDGGWGMVGLAAMLTLPPDVVEGGELEGDQIVYLFPSASALTTPFEFDAVSRFYGPSGDDHLTIIGADGTWFPTSG